MIATLSQLIARLESGNCTQAIRYEPGFERYITDKALNRLVQSFGRAFISKATARELLKYSYGKYQIMGQNLYDLGLTITPFDFLANESAQDAWFEEFIKSRKIDYSLDDILKDDGKRERFARLYNGDPVVYGKRMLEIYNYWSVKS